MPDLVFENAYLAYKANSKTDYSTDMKTQSTFNWSR